jgi:hypothetical protein
LKPSVSAAELAAVLLIGATLSLHGAYFETRIPNNDGKGVDGVYYYEMAEQIQAGERIRSRKPFVYRPGAPLLVAMTSPAESLLDGFLRVDVVANAITVILLSIWLSLWIESAALRILLSALFQAHWLGPIRFVWYYPALSDPPAIPLLLAFLIVVYAWQVDHRLRAAVLAIIAGAAVTMRENLLSLPLALPFLGLDLHSARDDWKELARQILRGAVRWLVPIITAVLAVVIVHLLVAARGPGGYGKTVLEWLGKRSPLTWLYSWFIVFGPLFGVLVFDWRASLAFLRREPFLLAYGAATVVLSYVGGSDTERLLIWVAPLVLVMLGRSLERTRELLRRPRILVPLVIGQILSLRLFWTIPRPVGCGDDDGFALLTRLGACAREADLFSYHASPAARVVGIVQYALVLGPLLYALYWARRAIARAV